MKGRELQFLLVKAEDDQGWWNMLLADKNAYKGRCKIDWDLWRDEDDEGDEKDVGDFGAGGMPGGMGGMPGMGMGGMGMVSGENKRPSKASKSGIGCCDPVADFSLIFLFLPLCM